MSYYFAKRVEGSFDDVIARVTDVLKTEGFGVLTRIDVQETLKKKLDADFRPYVILGSCNPPFAHRALLAEDKIGLMLPCNVVVQQTTDGAIEVSAIDPIASMQAVENESLRDIALAVQAKLRKVVESL
jgi:uncharacterized protein (DUF302 family)